MIKDYITVVIPCKNEEKYIGNVLEDLYFQYGFDGTRIIIADAGSSDATLDIIEAAKEELQLNIEVIKGGSVSIGRNAGAKLVNTEFVIFIDADTRLLDNRIISEIYLDMHSKDLFTCKLASVKGDILSSLMFGLFNIIQTLMKETFSTGMLMGIRKSVFDELGGFDETIHQSEDYLFTRKIPKRRFRILPYYIGQDDRRFKKMGYFGMIRMMANNYFHRKDENHFRKNINYWNEKESN